MRTNIGKVMATIAVALVASGCQSEANQAATPVAEAAQAKWPENLPVFGDGFPNPGDACRRVGESAATVDFLDDSATLAGCLSTADAATLGGKVVATIQGVTLVSVPDSAAVPGDGDGQGDAKVVGTKYNATAQIPCSGYQGAPAGGMCNAGVVRATETGTYIEVELPDGRQRTIFFNTDGSFLAFSTAEADGTAAMASGSSRAGDTTIATLGTERYEIPDVFVKGD